MPATKKNFFRIALLFLIIFSTVSCGSLKKQQLAADRAQTTSVPVSPPATASAQADTQVPIDTSLDQDIRTRHLEERINQLERRLALLEKQSGLQRSEMPSKKQASFAPAAPAKTLKPVAANMDLTPAKLYQKGRTQLLERNIDKAKMLFSDFIKEYPDHDLADNAMYWLGECSYTTGEYEKAIKIFKELVQTYSKGLKVPDALLKTGLAYLSMDDVRQADHYFKEVITRFPFSAAADKAQRKLSQTQ